MSFEDLPLFPEPEARTPSGNPRGQVLPRGEVPATSGTEVAGTSLPGTSLPRTSLPRTPQRPELRPPLPARDPYPYRAFRPRRVPAGLGSRLTAALLDLVALAALLALCWLGAGALGAVIDETALPALVLLAAVLSFLYTTLPLAFWGATPGMAAMGIAARSPGERPLSFRQAAARWLAGLLTLALAGLPGLLALAGASLTDRVSGSATLKLR